MTEKLVSAVPHLRASLPPAIERAKPAFLALLCTTSPAEAKGSYCCLQGKENVDCSSATLSPFPGRLTERDSVFITGRPVSAFQPVLLLLVFPSCRYSAGLSTALPQVSNLGHPWASYFPAQGSSSHNHPRLVAERKPPFTVVQALLWAQQGPGGERK